MATQHTRFDEGLVAIRSSWEQELFCFSEIFWLKLNGFLAEKGADIPETAPHFLQQSPTVVAREIPDSLRLSKRDYAYGYWQPPAFAASLAMWLA